MARPPKIFGTAKLVCVCADGLGWGEGGGDVDVLGISQHGSTQQVVTHDAEVAHDGQEVNMVGHDIYVTTGDEAAWTTTGRLDPFAADIISLSDSFPTSCQDHTFLTSYGNTCEKDSFVYTLLFK